MAEKVFTIPPGEDFLAVLAEGLWKKSGRDPLALSGMMVLLPNRRACRHLEEAFTKIAPATLLPRLVPLGDIDEEELYFSPAIDVDIPPAIAPLRRLMLLTQLVRKKDASLSCDQAALLAEALARFLDEAQTARCDMTKLPKLVEEKDLAEHWKKTVGFLEILTKNWPDMLAAEGCVDPARRRDLVLRKQAEAWRLSPPSHPVIAAGSTGTIPAASDLLVAVTALPKGEVILPGLDRDMKEDAWQAIDDTHPQSAIKHLLSKLGVDRRDVKTWFLSRAGENFTRIRLLQDSMHPAEADIELERRPFRAHKKLAGLSAITLDHPQEEAQAIALLMREALEAPHKTAALVTPDRGLAARVANLLRRWDIEANDSGGTPLLAEAPGGFLASVLAAASPSATATDYLALLKHPLAACGLDPAICRSNARALELSLWRTDRPQKSGWLDDVKSKFENLASSWNEALPLEDRIDAHLKAAEALAQSDTEEGASRLWPHEAGEKTREWCAQWRAAAFGFPALAGGDYAALFQGLLRAETFRPSYGQHPRLSILGPIEARLLRPDLVILGGLNEGTWPADPGIDPWMSRPMRKAFGLASPERRIGLSAHDFAQLASAPEAVLTRARRAGTALAVPSRFLLQLEAELRAQNYAVDALAPDQPYALWAEALDMPDAVKPCDPPLPKPPAKARPSRLSVTEIGTWRRNPYAIYARHILGLKKLEPLEAGIDASDRGALIHRALEIFVTKFPGVLPGQAYDEFLAIGRDVFARAGSHPEIFALWWPRFARMAEWFVAHERAQRDEGTVPVASEAKGEIKLGGFTLKGRADRIDRRHDGAYVITDYKTGGAPSNAEVKTGLEPQLPLLALIAAEGGFEKVPKGDVAALSYLKLTGSRTAGEEQTIEADIKALVDEARAGLMRLVEKFSHGGEPYRAAPEPGIAPRYDDYAHLARVDEWGRTGRDE